MIRPSDLCAQSVSFRFLGNKQIAEWLLEDGKRQMKADEYWNLGAQENMDDFLSLGNG